MSNPLGHASLRPDSPITAGQFGTWTLTYTAGGSGIDVGGGLRIYTDSDSDWGTPQFVDAAAPEYSTINAPEGVQPIVRTTGVKSLAVNVQGRRLEPAESITLVIGETSGGSPGARAQTFAEKRRFFWFDVDATGSDHWETLADSPMVPIVGDAAVRLVATAIPSILAVEETIRIVVKAEDQWGNPASGYSGTVTMSGEGFECEQRTVVFGEGDGGVKWIEDCKATAGGVLRVGVEDADNGWRTAANPVVVTATSGEDQLFWADPHGGQLVHQEKFAEFFKYARDVSGVQFVGFQRNADVISAEDWESQQQAEHELAEEGRFIPIPGYEWSGRTWEGGHHNVYFRRHGQPARRNLPVEDMFQAERAESELAHVNDLYTAYRNTDTIITPHVGGEHSDITFHEPSLEPAVEITSTHGSFEWMLFDSLKRGYRMGFLGGSDCYTGRPGDDRPGYQLRRYAKSGLTGIFVKDVSLGGFFEAMRARRVYATTGARIVLSLDVDGNPIGTEFSTADPPTISVAVAGTAPLQCVDMFRGTELVYSHPFEDRTARNRIRILWTGSSRKTSYSGVIWDGSATVSGAAVKTVQTIRFDSPRSHIVEHAPQTVRWHAWGCGYLMGVELELDEFEDPADVQIQVAVDTQAITGPGFGGHGESWPRRVSFAPADGAETTFRLADVLQEDREIPLGTLDRKVFLWSVPENRPLSADFQLLDDKPLPGWTAYWLRVIQMDGEAAWSSPVFVDYAGEA